MTWELGRARPKNKTYNYMTADIETGEKDGSALFGDAVYISWCKRGKGYGIASDDLTGWLLSEFLTYAQDGWILYIHNGFNFDLNRVNWERVADAGYDADFLTGNDNGIKAITVTKHDGEFCWFIRDSLLLLPMTLAKVTKTFAPDSQKIKRKYSFDEKPFDPYDPEDCEYAIQDSVGLYVALENVDQIFRKEFQVSVHEAATLPGLAYRGFRLMFAKDEKYPGISFQVAYAARESYHGGQTIVFQTRPFSDVVSIDANSMYSHVMLANRLPTGDVKKGMGTPPDDADHVLCLAVVNIPDGVFPVLKSKLPGGKVGNYAGIVTGWYWLFELEYQARLGATFEVVQYYQWAADTYAAGRYIEKCRGLRMRDYFGPLGAVGKLKGNSIYGRFAMQVGEYHPRLSSEEPEGAIPFYSPAAEDFTECIWLVQGQRNFNPDMTHWASFITAKARIFLTQAIEQIGFEHVIYCDTDSIFFERKYLDKARHLLGDNYGKFKIEKGSRLRGLSYQAVAPKGYKYIDQVAYSDNEKFMDALHDSMNDGSYVGHTFRDGHWIMEKHVVRNKGIPTRSLLKQQGFDRLGRAGQIIKYPQTNKIIPRLKKGEKRYGQIRGRTMATEKSTTNGQIIESRWVPAQGQPRNYRELIGYDVALVYQLTYDDIIKKFVERSRNH